MKRSTRTKFNGNGSSTKVEVINEFLMPKWNKYIPHLPHPKQHAFLLLNDYFDLLYGGAAGGGKSIAQLMAALQYVDVPGYNAILLRDTHQNLSKPGGLIPRSKEWLWKTDARWNDNLKQWTFPVGSTLSFGYLDSPDDHNNYQSSEFQYVGIDEASAIREYQARYMISRIRRTTNIPVPLRYRLSSNPPSINQLAKGAWIKRLYIDPETREDRIFLPADLNDNPTLDRVEYTKNLNLLDPDTRDQLLYGRWDAQGSTGFFKPEWWYITDTIPSVLFSVRYWDLAATNKDHSAFTAGVKMVLCDDGRFYITNIERFKKPVGEVFPTIKKTAEEDGEETVVAISKDPGQAGIFQVSEYAKNLQGFEFVAYVESGAKPVRAGAAATQVKYQNLRMVQGYWNKELVEEGRMFPDSEYKDQIDSMSGAYKHLVAKARNTGFKFAEPTGQTLKEMEKARNKTYSIPEVKETVNGNGYENKNSFAGLTPVF